MLASPTPSTTSSSLDFAHEGADVKLLRNRRELSGQFLQGHLDQLMSLIKGLADVSVVFFEPNPEYNFWLPTADPDQVSPELVAGLAQLVGSFDQTVVIPDLLADPRYRSVIDSTVSQPVRFYMSLPLQSLEGLNFGRLYLMDYQPQVLPPKILAQLETLAAVMVNQLNLAWDALDLLMSEQRLAVQYQVTRALAETNDLNEAIRFILKVICENLGWEVGRWWKVLAEQKLYCSQVWACDSVEKAPFEQFSPFDKGEGLPGYIWETAEPLWVVNLLESGFFRPEAQSSPDNRLRSVMGFPIVLSDQVFGVIEIFSLHTQPVNRDLLQMCRALGSQLGQFIERRRVQNALKGSWSTNRALLNALPDLMVRISGDGTFVNIKLPADMKLPLALHEVSDKRIDQVFAPDIARQTMDCVQEALRTEETQVLEYQLEVADHELRYYEARFAVSAKNEVISLIRDITERKEAELVLKARVRKQAVVAQLGQQALAGCSLSSLMDMVALSVAQALELDFTVITELSPAGDYFYYRAGSGWPEMVSSYDQMIEASTKPLHNYTLLVNEPVIVEDCTTETRFQMPSAIEKCQIVSCVNLVIHRQGVYQPFGTLSGYSSRPRQFSQDDIHFLQAVTNILAVVIEHQRSAQALRESEERLRTVVSNAPLVLFATDREGVFTLSEGYGLNALGLEPGQIVGQSALELYRDLPEITHSLQLALAGETLVATEQIANLTFETWYSPIRDQSGQLSGLIGVANDITERHRAQQAHQAEQDFALQVMNTMGEALSVTNEANLLEFVNPAYARLLDYSPSELVGMNPMKLLLEQDGPVLEALKASWVNPTSRKVVETHLKRKNGGLVYAQVTCVPIWRNGHKRGVITVLTDLTEQKRAENEIKKALQKEKELSELKSRFVSLTSHEFRTPLSTILTSAELLENYSHKYSEQKKLQILKRIQVSVANMTHLLNDVLLIGKAEAGKLDYNPVPLNLSDLCQSIVDELQLSTDAQHPITFINQCRVPLVLADEKLLRHILTNLISNAIKYSPDSGLITFEVECTTRQAVFRVKDQGIGIPAADQACLYGLFHRGSNVGTISGTGLGLAIVKRSVEIHGGTIEVFSEVGQGSTFVVTIPFGATNPESA